ncbi:uncharacterized protein ACN427_009327 [Glossina fuscipes fuscipes]
MMNQTNESIQPETHQGPKTEYLTYYCAFTGSELKVPIIPINQKRVEYPNKYFSETRDKPTMEITAYDCGLETLRSLLFDYLHATDIARSPTPDFIPHYMYLVAEKMKYNLTKRWESYGCTIEPGEVTPLSFVNITLSATRISAPNPNNSTSFNEKDDLWLMTQLSGAYRMGQTASTQRNTLKERINTLGRSQVKGIANYREYAYLTRFDTLQKMEKVTFMMATLDLFLDLVGKSPFSNIRIGTIVTQYHGMSAYRDLIYMSQILGYKDVFGFKEWVFFPQISSDLDQMFHDFEKEEFGVSYSYFPYCVPLRLTERSPYSVVHVVIHGVGSLMATKRRYDGYDPVSVLVKKGVNFRRIPYNSAVNIHHHQNYEP